MADIAMLVAEEYERRLKDGSRNKEEDDQMMVMMMLKKSKIDFKGVAQRIKNNIDTAVVNNKGLLEPKSQIGIAASNGFFSA